MALNIAVSLRSQDKKVVIYDLDMTKPLFRSRDVRDVFEKKGIIICCSEQFMDAPVSNIGVKNAIKENNKYVILDVGGNENGARAIGEYKNVLMNDDTCFFYIINPYRAWSGTIEHIDGILGAVLNASRTELKRIKFIANPNYGINTDAEDVVNGCKRLKEMLDPYAEISLCMVKKDLIGAVEEKIDIPVFPIEVFMPYPWEG
ncbi:MAG: hypothetical protein IJM53_00275 [Lachnospiraceae bacterium]|nr:hypothetical protein [Lachnospiraceae bacterium]